MDDLVIPFAGVFRDNNIREDISLEKMAELKRFSTARGRERSPPPIPPRSPTGRQRSSSPRRNGQKTGDTVQAYLGLGRTSAVISFRVKDF